MVKFRGSVFEIFSCDIRDLLEHGPWQIVWNVMTQYAFHISNGEAFSDAEEFADDEAACREALRTVRDIESAVQTKGGKWSLEVRRETTPIFQIDVTVRRL